MEGILDPPRLLHLSVLCAGLALSCLAAAVGARWWAGPLAWSAMLLAAPLLGAGGLRLFLLEAALTAWPAALVVWWLGSDRQGGLLTRQAVRVALMVGALAAAAAVAFLLAAR